MTARKLHFQRMLRCGESDVASHPLFQGEGGGSIPTSPLQFTVIPINKETAFRIYREYHYLGRQDFVNVASFGVMWEGCLYGAITFGPPGAKETVKGIFDTEEQSGFFEIKRLAIDNRFPKNSESRLIRIGIKLLRQRFHVLALLTYADPSVGHDGTIYKASGFRYLGLSDKRREFVKDGRVKQRGVSKGENGNWRDKPRKHVFVRSFDPSIVTNTLQLGYLKRKQAIA